MMVQINELPLNLRPRERLASSGPTTLSDTELLAILLGSGIKGKDVLQISSELLPLIDTEWETLSVEKLQTFPGIGAAKATLIIAALEFARRRIRPAGIKISAASDIHPLVRHIADRKQEHFICISLNGAHEVISNRVVTIGLLNSSQIHPRELYSEPIKERARSIIIAHNHPSGNLEPSEEDIRTTKILKEAGDILGIKLLDHIIFSFSGFYSFAEGGRI